MSLWLQPENIQNHWQLRDTQRKAYQDVHKMELVADDLMCTACDYGEPRVGVPTFFVKNKGVCAMGFRNQKVWAELSQLALEKKWISAQQLTGPILLIKYIFFAAGDQKRAPGPQHCH